MRMSRKAETLAKIGLFRSLDAAKIELLATQCSMRRATRNRWTMDYQDTTNDVLFVASATVRVKLQSVSGRKVLLRGCVADRRSGELSKDAALGAVTSASDLDLAVGDPIGLRSPLVIAPKLDARSRRDKLVGLLPIG